MSVGAAVQTMNNLNALRSSGGAIHPITEAELVLVGIVITVVIITLFVILYDVMRS